MDLNKIKKIYMIGIKGVGMTMLAQYLATKGVKISGSDTKEKFMTDEVLKKSGIKVIEKFNKSNIPEDVDLIIYSTGYNANTNVEITQALKSRIKVLIYAEALGEIFNQQYGIAVIGTHGKTTACAWLGYVMDKTGLSPSVMVGAQVPQFQGLSLVGKSGYLVAEIDEYQNKLKYFQPKAILLNNIEYDHPDFFSTLADYKNVFVDFIKKLPSKGFLVANYDNPIIRKIAQVNCRGKVITYAIDNAADFIAYDIKLYRNKQYFKVKLGIEDDDEPLSGSQNRLAAHSELGDFSIQLIGKHNISNALAVISASVELGVELVDIRKYLEEFEGTTRRMQILGEFKGATIIDDYAHHPTEIKATLASVRELYKEQKIVVVFHPHTFTRTKALFNDFIESFKDTDVLIIIDIYGSAREKHGGVHSRDLVEKIKIKNKELGIKQDVKYISTLEKCEEYLREHAEKEDLILLMGAGDIFRVGENLIK